MQMLCVFHLLLLCLVSLLRKESFCKLSQTLIEYVLQMKSTTSGDANILITKLFDILILTISSL